MNYQPSPIDTSTVELGPELLELTERLAENVHDVWAVQRLEDGWRFGFRRDDAKKEHPCLVAYDDLPESEKLYDRGVALQTLKAIVALGFRIEPPESTADEPQPNPPGLPDIP
jgi:ryanodine receptor 2